MKKETKNFLGILVIVLLICLIVTVINNKDGTNSKEVKIAKNFISELSKEKIIQSDYKENTDFKVTIKDDKENDKKIYELDNETFMVKINENYEVINFVDKIKSSNIKSISEEEAIKIAKKYIKEIDDSDYKFDKVIEQTRKDSVSYYSISFKRYDEGYPYFSSDVILNIDKSNGKLEGYLNNSGKTKHGKVNIKISEDEAKEKCLKAFNSMLKDGKVIDKVYLAYGESRENLENLELSYIVNVKGKLETGEEKQFTYFVSASSGEIINSFSNRVEEIKSK
ncbi:PepSY domain-containing protein [Clostridium sp. LY3-2]|uniref:PepSY domain-containing protein n=1 Tax=Clostridium sp. LY3-2 TaxID=2942482 RepID=UPI002153872A|nr:PepSY domain-containing protein [Clostridium sp. LY3-2]MCR6513440.1 PepSY domain-containing protein [Clostridium sp. LY3-2]